MDVTEIANEVEKLSEMDFTTLIERIAVYTRREKLTHVIDSSFCERKDMSELIAQNQSYKQKIKQALMILR